MQRYSIVFGFRSKRIHMRARLSLAQAFEAQGVTLKDPERSWSGIRDADGAVVIAMSEADIHATGDGFSCLLWAPVIEVATEWGDGPGKEERLAHCRLAAILGSADGLVVRPASADVEADAVLTLRVEKRRNEYWAMWGSTVRLAWHAGRAMPNGQLVHALAAA